VLGGQAGVDGDVVVLVATRAGVVSTEWQCRRAEGGGGQRDKRGGG
jgi:hypothetical protein